MTTDTATPAELPLTPTHKLPVRHLLGLLGGILLGLLAMLLYFQWRSHQQIEISAATTTRNLALALESRVHGDLQRAANLLELIVSDVRPDQLLLSAVVNHNAALSIRLADLLSQFPPASLVNLFNAQGELLYSSNPKIKHFKIDDWPHFKRLRDDPKAGLIFSEVQISRSTGQRALLMARALRDRSGRFAGVAVLVINLHEYTQLFGDIDVGTSGVALIRRSDDFKLVLRHPSLTEQLVNQPLPDNHPVRQRIQAGQRSASLTLRGNSDGVRRLVSYRQLNDYPFYVEVGLAEADYLADWQRQSAIAAALAALLLLTFAVAAGRMLRVQALADRVAQRLLYREALFRALFEQSTLLAGVLDSSGHLIEVNERALSIIGASREQVLGRYFPDTPWWHRAEDRARLEQLLHQSALELSGPIEVVHNTADGQSLIVQFHVVPVHAGPTLLIAVTGVDITELKRTQQQIETLSERMELALRGGDLGLWDWQMTTGTAIVNERWCSMLGYRLDEVRPHVESWRSLVHPDDWPSIDAALELHLSGQAAAYLSEHRLRHKDGHWVWVLDRGQVVARAADGTPLRMVGTHMDISERKQLEVIREQALANLQKITARVPGLVYQFRRRPDGRFCIPFASDGIHQIFRVSPQQVRDDAAPVLARLHPDDLDDVVASIEQSARDLSPWQHEFQVQFDDGTLRWLRGHALPEREPDGGTLWHGFISDITERKDDETELLRSNHELEQFSYSISHDMRQPLRMISSFMQLLHRRLATQLDGEQQEFFSFAIDGAKRLDQMMLALLDYSRVGRKGEPPSWVESRQLLDEALHYLAPARIEAAAQIDIEGDWPPIFVSRDEMLRLLQNLISNALKFRLPERMPVIRVSGQITAEHWRLCVADNGVGVLPDQAGRLFQVFARLQSRADYEGNGVGLALCRKIIEHHGGRIWVESDGAGLGSQFWIELPLPAERAA